MVRGKEEESEHIPETFTEIYDFIQLNIPRHIYKAEIYVESKFTLTIYRLKRHQLYRNNIAIRVS